MKYSTDKQYMKDVSRDLVSQVVRGYKDVNYNLHICPEEYRWIKTTHQNLVMGALAEIPVCKLCQLMTRV